MAGFLSSVINKLSFNEMAAETGPLTEARLHQWLVERIAKQLKIPPGQVDPSRSFESYGLDSLAAIKLAGDLEKLVEQRLSPALLFEHQSVDALARYLTDELSLTELS